MFSGIIEEVASVKRIIPRLNTYEVRIKSKIVYPGVKAGDSIAVDGVCLTLKNKNNYLLSFDVMKITFENTKFKYLKINEDVNLEKALGFQEFISGHLVSGHIDTVLEVQKVIKKKDLSIIYLKIPQKFIPFVVEKGSIAVNGVSLTVQEMKSDLISINCIPYTLKMTNLKKLKANDKVNVEFDLLAKYVFNYLKNVKS